MANTLKLGSAINIAPLASAPSSSVAGDLYYDSTLGTYRFKDGSVWNEIQTANNSYIKNSNANNGTTGYATYKDAAQSTPVDGTGGSPTTVTIATTQSTPLRGANSFTMAKSAANGQGEGMSYAFSVDYADQAKVMDIEFDYIVSSGTFAAGTSNLSPSDVTIWVQDVTNGTIIQPSSISLYSNSSTTSDRFRASFQTAFNSTSYRLIFHVASTSASAYTLKFDDIQIKRSNVIFGCAISDWESFTASGGWTTNTTYTGRRRRIGDSMECYVSVSLTGAPNSAGLSINIPPGYSIDTNKLATASLRNSLGTVSILDSGLRVYVGTVAYLSTTSVFLAHSEAGANGVDQSSPITFGSGDGVGVFFTVPIAGWSSSVQFSQDTDTRIVAMINQTSLPTIANFGGSADIIWGTAPSVDTHGCYNTTTGKYTVPVAGIYRVSTYLACAGTEATDARMILILAKVNAAGTTTTIITETRVMNSGLTRLVADGSCLVSCQAGDQLSIRCDNDVSGATISNNGGNKFEVERLCGPSAIAASEAVSCRYTNVASQSFPNASGVALAFDTRVWDTHGAFNTANSTFTAPISGYYQINYYANFTGLTIGSGEVITIVGGTNSSSQSRGTRDGVSASAQGANFSATIYCLAGQTIVPTAYVSNSAGSRLTEAGTAWITIAKVG